MGKSACFFVNVLSQFTRKQDHYRHALGSVRLSPNKFPCFWPSWCKPRSHQSSCDQIVTPQSSMFLANMVQRQIMPMCTGACRVRGGESSIRFNASSQVMSEQARKGCPHAWRSCWILLHREVCMPLSENLQVMSEQTRKGCPHAWRSCRILLHREVPCLFQNTFI